MKKIYILLLSIISFTSFGQNWDEMIKLVAFDRDVDDYFGYNVVINENRAVVSSYFEDEDAAGGDTKLDAGSVYVFERNNNVWGLSAKLVASDRAADDRFGCRVGIDGDKIIIGSFLEDENVNGGSTMNEAGSAYIFELINGIWTETAKIVASDRASGSRFGFDVDISGNTAIVGSYYNPTDVVGANSLVSAGASYIFELVNGVWTETAKLVASDRDVYNYFGYSVCLEGSTAIIGAQGNKYDATGGGSYLTNSGAVYVFEKNGGLWAETAKLVASDRGMEDNFGQDAAISNNTIVVGAFKDGDDATGTNPITEAGSVYVFDLIGGVWTESAKLVASDRLANSQFGVSVDIDQDKIVVGAKYNSTDASGGNILTDAGSAYIFEYAGGVLTETAKLVASDRADGDNFGNRVSISGNKVIIAAMFEDEDGTNGNSLNDAGSVYLFNTCMANPDVAVVETTLTASLTGAAYQWLDCDNGNAPLPSETNQTFTATAIGNYAVVVTDGNCVDTSACINISTNGLNELDNAFAFSLFPNPATNQVTISNFNSETDRITIIDLAGQILMDFMPESDVFDVYDLKKGIYFVKIQVGDKTITKRLVKK